MQLMQRLFCRLPNPLSDQHWDYRSIISIFNTIIITKPARFGLLRGKQGAVLAGGQGERSDYQRGKAGGLRCAYQPKNLSCLPVGLHCARSATDRGEVKTNGE